MPNGNTSGQILQVFLVICTIVMKIALFLGDETFLKHTSELMNVATSNFPFHCVQSAFLTSPLTFPEAPAN